MPLSTDQLRELLTERSAAASYHPAPHERIRMRIRRARLRRTAAVGLVAAIAVVTGLGIATSLHRPSSDQVAAGRQPFPASFTASDGASYRLVAVTSLVVPAQKSVTIKLKVGPDPVDVMGACDGIQGSGGAVVGVAVNGANDTGFACPGAPELISLPVRLGSEADITFTKPAIAGNIGATTWRFAVYEWKPSAVARPAPPAPRLPSSYTSYNTTTGHGQALRRLIASRSGDWPADRTFAVTVPFRGRNIDISAACSGAIAGRLTITLTDNGRALSTPLQCKTWTPGTAPPDSTTYSGRTGVSDTLTFRIQVPSPAADYAKRAASWTIAIYEEEF